MDFPSVFGKYCLRLAFAISYFVPSKVHAPEKGK